MLLVSIAYCFLSISDIPTVNITTNNSDQFFLLFMEHHLQCHVQSVPYPTSIQWYWQPCYSPNNCTTLYNNWELIQRQDWSPVSYRRIEMSMSADRQTNISTLIVRESRVGFYKCVGNNSMGSNHSVIQYIASGN